MNSGLHVSHVQEKAVQQQRVDVHLVSTSALKKLVSLRTLSEPTPAPSCSMLQASAAASSIAVAGRILRPLTEWSCRNASAALSSLLMSLHTETEMSKL